MKTTIFLLLMGLWANPLALWAFSGDFETRIKAAELSGNRQEVAAICKEWYASGDYSPGLLNWNYNALMSVEQNAILFTQQETDTYPALLLQYALDVRPDVIVLSFQWLNDPVYRARVLETEGLTWIPPNSTLQEFLYRLVHPSSKVAAKPVYFGSMTNKELLQTDRDKLYLTGLALKYSGAPFDNLATLRYNFEHRFRTDYLELNFEPEKDPAAVARINLNYLPAVLMLYRHYGTAGEFTKANHMQHLALKIAREGGREEEVREYIGLEVPESPVLSVMTPRSLEKNMKKVEDRLYASAIETTNAQYELFLTDLLKNKEFEQLAACKTTKTNWYSLLPQEWRSLPENRVFEHAHPDEPSCPVQNITYEAARKYCAWITLVYNSSQEKKKFKKVLFRLPTEEEWMRAARAGRGDAPYPWGGYFIRNSKGCYLANYQAKEP
ncbi:MAG: SUMF1/EgtB/PvdO family nonheme iron enzyme, partial [Saprospiraceae bacterium]|nr:SUMF1/EgtB/PvdO family nonheme iron enzyme [Saprospiraceae bacterium]